MNFKKHINFSYYNWIAVISSALFFFYIFLQMTMLSSLGTELTREFNFTAKEISQLVSSYCLGNMLFLFPAGILIDRFSAKKFLILIFSITIMATYLFSITNSFFIMNILRLIIGITGAFSFILPVKLASGLIDRKYIAIAVGLIVTIGMLGGITAQTPITIINSLFGWRTTMKIISLLGILFLSIQIIFIKKIEPNKNESSKKENIPFFHSLKLVIFNKQNWLVGIYVSLINLPIYIFGGLWATVYLTQIHKFNQIQASQIIVMLFIGMMIGSPLSGLISDKIGLRKFPMIIGAILCIVLMLLIMFLNGFSYGVGLLLYFIFGLVMSIQVIGYPVIAESNHLSTNATATSLSAIIILAGGLLTPVYAWLLENSNQQCIKNGIIQYSSNDFMRANLMILIGFIIALLSAIKIKETFCKSEN